MVYKQQGTVTRIVSGCDPEQEKEMTQVFKEKIAIMSDNFHLHFTPEFGKVPGKSFQTTKYWNKVRVFVTSTTLKSTVAHLQLD